MTRRGSVALAAGMLWGLVNVASADEIVFTNGDRLSGEVVRLVEGTLTLKSQILGQIEVDAARIQTFSTSKPVEIHTREGTILKDVVVKGDPGEIHTAGTSPVGPQTFALTEMVALNPPPREAPAWKGTLTAGLDIERGNSFTTEADVVLDAVRETEYNRIRFNASYEGDRNKDQSTGNSNTTERSINFLLRYDNFLSEKIYWYGSGEGEKDGVQSLNLRFTGGAGFGYRWYNTKDFKAEGDLGLSWISENYKEGSLDEDFIASIVNWSIERRLPSLISDRLTFYQRGKWWVSLEDWDDKLFARITTGIRSDLTPRTFLEAKIVWEYDSEPAAGIDRQDIDYIFGLGVRF